MAVALRDLAKGTRAEAVQILSLRGWHARRRAIRHRTDDVQVVRRKDVCSHRCSSSKETQALSSNRDRWCRDRDPDDGDPDCGDDRALPRTSYTPPHVFPTSPRYRRIDNKLIESPPEIVHGVAS
jgi:hypothetical protein